MPSTPDPDDGLNAYGDAFDVTARMPTLTGVIVAAIATALVWTWRRAVNHSPRT